MRYLFFFLLIISCAHKEYHHPFHNRFSVLQLYTSESSVEFNILLPKSHNYKFSVLTPEGKKVLPTQSLINEFEDSEWVIQNIAFTDLPTSDQTFKLQIESILKLEESREFRLFSQNSDTLRFIIGSCADERITDQKIYDQISRLDPEWVFLIGDNHYANSLSNPEPHDIWDSSVRARQKFQLYFFSKLIPTHATWDDNDFGTKDGDKNFKHKEASQYIFKAFFQPQILKDQILLGPGVSSRLMLRGMHFSFLDNRSFRDPPQQDGDHFGGEQEEWFFNDLKKEQLPTWIISGDQFFGGYHDFESFEGLHPQRFDQFITKLKDVQTPFVFVSGDRHLSEIMQFPRAVLGQLSFEFTSSPMHAKTYPGSLEAKPNPWRVVAVDGVQNMLYFEAQLQEQSWRIKTQAVSSQGEILFSRNLSLTTERLKDFDARKPKIRKYRRARWRRR